ncbi:MAG: hypothetical protein LBH70_02950 [Spirochaetaceae bacterium]|jgi:hypothetical protein|nr:hypothetical protein [Spirochaetaceae bacterium]
MNNDFIPASTAAYHAAEASNTGKIDREDRRQKRAELMKNIRKIKNACLNEYPLNAGTSEILLDFSLHTNSRIRSWAGRSSSDFLGFYARSATN